MEKLSHSRRPNKPFHSLPKMPCNVVAAGFGSSKATNFDDVFGGPPRFGAPSLSPKHEDYCEIFGGFHVSSRFGVSSIPVLDLPVIDGGDVYFDVTSPGFDYGEVFGGFQDLDFAPSYDELLMEQFEGGDDDSSNEAWTPGEAGSISGETEHSEKSPCFSNGRDSYESIDGTTDFHISYHKAGQRVDHKTFNGITRVASVPGYTFAVDESAYEGAVEGKQLKKTWSYPAHSDTKGHVSEHNLKSHKSYSRMQSCPGERFVSVSDISLKTVPSELPPPSRPPPLLRKNSNSSASNCRTTGSEGSLEGSSPPFFDVEIDASSAAVRNGMEKAQAKLKCAKESLVRKRDESRTHVNPSLVNGRMVRQGKSSGNETFFFVGSNEVEKRFSLDRNSPEDMRGKKSISSQGSEKLDANDEWKEAYQFFELARDEKLRNAVENVRVHNDMEFHEARQNENLSTEEVLEKEQERREKEFVENNDAEILLKRPEVTTDAQRHKKHEKKARAGKNVLQKGIEEKYRKVVQHVETEGETFDGSEKQKNRCVIEIGENETFAQQPTKPKKREVHQKQTTKDIKDQKNFKKSLPREAGRNKQNDMFDWEENARKLREALAMAENGEILEAVLEQDIGGNKPKESVQTEETEKKLTEALERVENERRCALDAEQIEDLKRLKEDYKKEQNDLRLKVDLEKEEKRRLKEAREKEENELRLREAFEQAENLRKMKAALEQEALEREETERQQTEAREKEEKDMKLKEATEKEEMERRREQALEQEEREKRQREAREREQSEKQLKEAAYKREESEIRVNETRKKEAREESKGHGRKRLETNVKDELKEERHGREETRKTMERNRIEAAALKQEESRDVQDGACSWNVFQKNVNDAGKMEVLEKLDEEDETCQSDGEDKLRKVSRGDHLPSKDGLLGASGDARFYEENYRLKRPVEAGITHGLRSPEEDNVIFETSSSMAKDTRKYAFERENRSNIKHSTAALDQEENNGSFLPPRVGKNLGETKRKEDAAKTAVPSMASQSTIRKDVNNFSEAPNQGEKEAKMRRRERELENERLRKIEEEKEREREREKDRMAMGQRALAEARERLEKAFSEARNKSSGEKSSMEATLRAEKAAVERATAEVRERAAGRAAPLAKERMERPVSDKRFQSSNSFGASRYQNPPSAYVAGVDGESQQRHTSRLERHRRTDERVAKALAEKNMRDLLVQREQAERNRLAETLDADVKRWSSGKEGNIRALLSTLQYILDSQSGWQPIHLTEVITSAAVKKAYRKATLCVHPDKLQQRGASIQQKYICEKVYNLLKEAWNRFNSEER